eukprot:jgi/Mesvir1/1030/Mv17557-RA.1
MSRAPLLGLPDECLQTILSRLELDELARLMTVCRALSACAATVLRARKLVHLQGGLGRRMNTALHWANRWCAEAEQLSIDDAYLLRAHGIQQFLCSHARTLTHVAIHDGQGLDFSRQGGLAPLQEMPLSHLDLRGTSGISCGALAQALQGPLGRNLQYVDLSGVPVDDGALLGLHVSLGSLQVLLLPTKGAWGVGAGSNVSDVGLRGFVHGRGRSARGIMQAELLASVTERLPEAARHADLLLDAGGARHPRSTQGARPSGGPPPVSAAIPTRGEEGFPMIAPGRPPLGMLEGAPLRLLNLAGHELVTDAGVLAVCEHCHNLTSLDVSLCAVTPALLPPLTAHCRRLQVLVIDSMFATGDAQQDKRADASVKCVAEGLPDLQSLDLGTCPYLSDTGLIQLSSHPSLQVKLRQWAFCSSLFCC